MDIDNVWEKIKKGIKDGAAVSLEKVEEYSKIGKLKIEEITANRKIERNFTDMGERLFDLIEENRTDDIKDDLAIQKAIENIKSLKSEISGIDDNIKKIYEEYQKNDGSEDDEYDEPTGV